MTGMLLMDFAWSVAKVLHVSILAALAALQANTAQKPALLIRRACVHLAERLQLL